MRPKKTESQRLTKTVLFRLTELEEAQLKRTAAQCGMSVSDYCRAAILDDPEAASDPGAAEAA